MPPDRKFVITPSPRLAPILAAVTLARTVINGMRRFPYVILTPMSAALGVPRSTLEATLSLQWATGAISPFAGPTIERIGRKRTMLIAMVSMSIFTGIAALGQTAGIILAMIVACGISKILYDPAMQAYIGDRTPYRLRGLAIGITELSWSGALVVFAPLAAYLIKNVSLNAIFGVIAVACGIATLMIAVILPGDVPIEPQLTSRRLGFGILWASRPALAMLAVGILISFVSESMSIVYEAWLIQAFALSVTALGTLSLGISAAEVIGEGFVIAIADRFGKRRLALIALVATGLADFILPLTAGSPPAAVVGLFMMFLTFEIAIVALIPLATEVLPNSRGMMMTSNIAALAIGRAIGAVVGGLMFRSGGYLLNGVVGLVLNLIAVALIWYFIPEH